MTVVRARLTVTGVAGRSMLVMASARHVCGVWHRVVVIVRFRGGRVHLCFGYINEVSIPSAALVLVMDSLASFTAPDSALTASIVSGITMA